MAAIEKTGDLREFLARTINGVANGTVSIEKAREVGKLASQINESFYAEVKVARTQQELGREADKLGDLPLNSTKD